MKNTKTTKIASDVIIKIGKGIVLIERKNPPYGWAIPGGFVEYGESVEETAKREMKEETGLNLKNLEQFHTYSKMGRDPRGHTVTIVFTAKGIGTPHAGDDAGALRIFTEKTLPKDLAFDHKEILKQYFNLKREKKNGKRK